MVDLSFQSNMNARVKRLENLVKVNAQIALPATTQAAPVNRVYNVKDGPTTITETPTLVFPPGKTLAKILCIVRATLATAWNDQPCPASTVGLTATASTAHAGSGCNLLAPFHVDITPGAAPAVGSTLIVTTSVSQFDAVPSFSVATTNDGPFSGFTTVSLTLSFDFEITYF